MKDYRGSESDPDYLPPEERRIASDFPPKESLYVYGEDFPMPESFDDLRSHYNEDERNPLILEDLRGYHVPPLGLGTVGVNGIGFQPGNVGGGGGGFIYPQGTFREAKYHINAELGATSAQTIMAREEARKNALTQGAIEALEEMGLAVFDNLKEKDAGVIKELTKQTIKMICEADNPREMLNFLKYIDKRQQEKDDAINNQRNKQAKLTLTEAKEWIELGRKAMNADFEIIDGEIEDVEDE